MRVSTWVKKQRKCCNHLIRTVIFWPHAVSIECMHYWLHVECLTQVMLQTYNLSVLRCKDDQGEYLTQNTRENRAIPKYISMQGDGSKFWMFNMTLKNWQTAQIHLPPPPPEKSAEKYPSPLELSAFVML